MPKGLKGFQKGHKFFGDLSKPTYFKRGMKPWNLNLKYEQPKTQDEKHPNWQGDKVSYAGLHAWLKRKYGKADRCENVDCPKIHKIFHWAKLKDKEYERKRENFMMLCIKCHNNYDNLGFKKGHPKNYQSVSEYYNMQLES